MRHALLRLVAWVAFSCFVAAHDASGQEVRATVKTRGGELIEGVFIGAGPDELTLQVAGRSLRLALEEVMYVSFVGRLADGPGGVSDDGSSEESPDDGAAGPDTTAVGDYDRPPRVVEMVQPIYPLEAYDKGVEGTVVLEIWIGVDGRVVRARVLESIPLLDVAAIDCVKRWRFEPALKDGKPVMVAARAPITFKLALYRK